MDGTIADLYGVKGWEKMLRAENPLPYEIAAPMWDMELLTWVLRLLQDEGWEIRIITWLSKDSSEEYKAAVRKAKMAWLKKYDFPMDKTHMVAYGTTKANTVRNAARNAILIDDNDKVREGWTLGETINPETENIIEALHALLE